MNELEQVIYNACYQQFNRYISAEQIAEFTKIPIKLVITTILQVFIKGYFKHDIGTNRWCQNQKPMKEINLTLVDTWKKPFTIEWHPSVEDVTSGEASGSGYKHDVLLKEDWCFAGGERVGFFNRVTDFQASKPMRRRKFIILGGLTPAPPPPGVISLL